MFARAVEIAGITLAFVAGLATLCVMLALAAVPMLALIVAIFAGLRYLGWV